MKCAVAIAAPASLPRVQKPGVPVFWVIWSASVTTWAQVAGGVLMPALVSRFLL